MMNSHKIGQRYYCSASFIAATCFLLVACDASTPATNNTPQTAETLPSRYHHSSDLIETSETSKSFDDVVFELEFAITERNYRITGKNTIGKGLRTRGYTDFPNVEVIHFCNLEYAREVLLIDPGFVAQMPCRITIHEQAEKTIISLVLLPEDHENEEVNDFSRRMNGILRDIVEFVVDPES